MNVRTNVGRLMVGLAAAAVLAACATGASPTPAPASPTPTSMPSAALVTPTPSATPAASGPIAYGPVTVVTGTNNCPGLYPNFTRNPDGSWQVRDLAVECIDETNDPRVSGTHTATWSMDFWGDPSIGYGAGVQSGTVRLENAGGAWEGWLSGIYSSLGGDSIVVWYKGTGGYAGLSYFELVTGSEPWTIHGQIFPGDPPTP